MLGSRFTNTFSQVPGPGQYNPKEEFSKTMVPSYAIGKARRMNSKDPGIPGPGSYELSPKNEAPKWKLGTQQRLSASLSEIPGPGAYECSSDTSRPAYSMTARRPLTSDSYVPGPGAYTPKHLFGSVHYSVGHAKREQKAANEVPGPASYNAESPKGRGTVIGSSKRDFVLINDKNPGPGAYENLKAWQGPKFTLRARTTDKSTEEVPVNDI